MALAHTAPLGLLYVAWSAVGHPSTSTVFGRPTIKVLVLWVRSSVVERPSPLRR